MDSKKLSVPSKISREVIQSRIKIQVYPDLCGGCGSCELICSLFHEGISNPKLSRITLIRDPIRAEFKIHLCKQCDAPECMASCPVKDAMYVDERGVRVINEDECIGCGNCARACPFNGEGLVIKYNSEKNTYFKCNMCIGLDKPLCVEICPHGALKLVESK